MGPRVGIEAALASQALDEGAIHDGEIEAELLQHLVAPLDLQRRWADDQDAVGAVPKHQFEHDHAGFYGLAKANIVGDEQVYPRHLDGADHGVELVALDLDAAAEWRLKLAGVGNRRRAPPDGVQEGFEMSRLIEALWLGQLHFLEGTRSRLDFPDDLQFFPKGIVFDRGKADQVLWLLQKLRAIRALADIGYDVPTLPHDGQLPLLGNGSESLH